MKKSGYRYDDKSAENEPQAVKSRCPDAGRNDTGQCNSHSRGEKGWKYASEKGWGDSRDLIKPADAEHAVHALADVNGDDISLDAEGGHKDEGEKEAEG